MNELTKDQWKRSMSTGFGDPDHPINSDVKDHVGKLKIENAEMAMSDINKIIKYSEELQKMFNPSQDLEDWVEAKLTHAVDYVSTVRDYLKFYNDETVAGTPSNEITEKWTKKYKRGIDCSHPKGFSQRAHCAGRRARRAGKHTKSSSVSEVELYNDVLKDLVEEILDGINDSSMSMGALKQLNSDAKELMSMLKPETQLEDWVKAKLNLAGEYLDDVYHHLDHFGPEGRKLDKNKEVDEAVTDPRFVSMKNMSPEELERYIIQTQRKKKESSPILIQKAYWIDPNGNLISVKTHDSWAKERYPDVKNPKMEAFKHGYIRMAYSVRDNGRVDVEFQNIQSPTGEVFNKNGNSSLGIPPVKSTVLDVITQFIRDKNSLTSDVTDGNLEESMSIEENWRKMLGTAALAAATAFGTPNVDAAQAKAKKPVATAVKKKASPSSVKKTPAPEKKVGGKVFVNPAEIPTNNAMEAYVLRNEGAVRNLYYIGGKPHIGVGHHLDGSSGSKDHIRAILLSSEEIDQIKDEKAKETAIDTNQKLSKYVSGKSVKDSIDDEVMLTNSQIAKLFALDFSEKQSLAKKRHPKFNALPSLVKTMVIDSIFRGEKHPKTDELINSDNPDWNAVAKAYLDDAEYKKGGGVAIRMDRNANLLRRAAEEQKSLASNPVKEQGNV